MRKAYMMKASERSVNPGLLRVSTMQDVIVPFALEYDCPIEEMYYGILLSEEEYVHLVLLLPNGIELVRLHDNKEV